MLQHVPFEGPAAIGDWAAQRGHALATRRLFEGEALPEIDEADALLVMGGPMGANDDAHYPWMRPERERVAAFLGAGKPLLGICLGAQILARAAGARVYPGPEKEIGWLPAERMPAASDSLLAALPDRFVPFHWHGDTFDLPAGARHLVRSERCTHQAFQLGPCALGLQFHLEATLESIAAMLQACADELGEPGSGIQTADAIRGAAAERVRALHEPLLAMLDAWSAAGADG